MLLSAHSLTLSRVPQSPSRLTSPSSPSFLIVDLTSQILAHEGCAGSPDEAALIQDALSPPSLGMRWALLAVVVLT